ncbi:MULTISPECIES: DNA topoisomerase IV subunit A [unclassified Roseateles]|uniref:DNA topoisomerase IV subunit A n=1 Tax=unclassified Roseateles TaxID=2626991 RepID=UPI0006FFA1F9|nr:MULTISPECIES: DNA topoisomerase IV subunit A [unclassified Roseateles]KQW41241.1 DNA topoisomerase IV subunit A [Pelomonas sp. Root405]KRA68012.1 DNA topoisomerase IV subunit A [Pelomonas sp. Root662]
MSSQTPIDFDLPTEGDDANALTLAAYAQQAYLEYALSVVKGRALPSYADGQKPVQRRILYSMHRLGLGWSGNSGAKPVKGAKVVGDVLGSFHPHGDQSVYDALVRMAQDFSLRYPLIDGHGNFGSRDGDGAAAMRYTEARLAPIARLVMDEIDEGTVDFRPNYDGTTQEPVELPARLPFVLLNGASGIAVGLATEIPSHNLREVAAAAVALLKDDKLGDDALYDLIPGPDFPGGGQLISAPEEIRAAYASGRGSLKLRARWKIEDLARGQWQLVVTELPHGTSAQKVLEEIEELSNPKVKAGKKTLSADQLQLKAGLLAVLDVVRDESSKDAAVRIVFEPKSRTVEQQDLINTLLAHTSLESSAPVNLTMIGADGRPTQKSLREMLAEWVGFRQVTVRRRTEHRLAHVNDRIHVLEGRQLVLLNIDEVIRIIRESDEPKTALIAHFKLSDRQAEDILEIRLRQLARLEAIKIEQELAKLRDERAKLEDILGSAAALRRTVIKEIEADAKQYGDDRRTLIQAEKRITAEVRIVDEPVTVIVSQKGWVRALKGHEVDVAAQTFKAGDALRGAFRCRSVDPLVVIASNGRVYSVPVSTLPGGRGDGQPITTMIELESGSQIAHYMAAAASQRLVMAGSTGYGLIAQVGDLVGRQKAGKTFLALDEGEQPLVAAVPATVVAVQLGVLSAQGRLLTFSLDELKHQPKGGKGLMLMDLEAKDTLASVACFTTHLRVLGSGRGGKPREELLKNQSLAAHASKRARKGKAVDGLQKVARLTAELP